MWLHAPGDRVTTVGTKTRAHAALARDWIAHEGATAAEAAGALIVKLPIGAAERIQTAAVDGEGDGEDLGIITVRFIEQDPEGITAVQIATEVNPATEHVGDLVDLIVGQTRVAGADNECSGDVAFHHPFGSCSRRLFLLIHLGGFLCLWLDGDRNLLLWLGGCLILVVTIADKLGGIGAEWFDTRDVIVALAFKQHATFAIQRNGQLLQDVVAVDHERESLIDLEADQRVLDINFEQLV